MALTRMAFFIFLSLFTEVWRSLSADVKAESGTTQTQKHCAHQNACDDVIRLRKQMVSPQ